MKPHDRKPSEIFMTPAEAAYLVAFRGKRSLMEQQRRVRYVLTSAIAVLLWVLIIAAVLALVR